MKEQVFLPDEARRVVRDYACAQCWGPLIERYDWRLRVSEVECPRCGSERGIVTRRYAELRLAESRAEWAEARANLGWIAGIEPKSTDELLSELGFGGGDGH